MKLHHIAITVKDFETSMKFYSEFFGFKEVQNFRRDDIKATGHFIQGENVMIELWQFDNYQEGIREDLEFSGIKHIAFTHDGPESLREEFLQKGIVCGPFRTGASGGKYFFLQDPDGNQIEIYKPLNLN